MPTSTAIPLTLKWAARCCSTATLHYVPLSAFLTEPSCYRTVDSPKLFWREVVSKQKPRSEWRGWEISFKQALLLRAEGAIRAFFDGYCRGDTASGACGVAILCMPSTITAAYYYADLTSSLFTFTYYLTFGCTLYHF